MVLLERLAFSAPFFFFFFLSSELLKLQQLSRNPGLLVRERDGQEVVEKAVCVFETLRIVLLGKRNVKGMLSSVLLNTPYTTAPTRIRLVRRLRQ